MQLTTLTELVHSPSLRIDRQAGLIRGVKVLGYESANGRSYQRQAVSRARPLYEGIRVNIDHVPAGRGDADRKLADRFGRLVNVRETESGLFADLDYLRSHPLAELMAEAAERMPEALGLSHNAEGRVRTGDDGRQVVEEIVRVKSVDLVSDPATTRTLFESHATGATGAGGASATDGAGAATGSSPEAGGANAATEPPCSLEEARHLCAAAGITPLEPLVEALAALPTPAQRQALLEVWPAPQPLGSAPAYAPPRSAAPRQHTATGGRLPVDLANPQATAAFLRGRG